MSKQFIGYFRVSTQRQGQSGLGLEAQRASVRKFVEGRGELLTEYTETESGKRSDRPELLKALAHSRRSRATLLIAKLDRLARNVAFTSSLMESGADFVAVDIPQANKLTIHILAAVAEDEAMRISQRTKAALSAYKARGGLLGSNHPKCREISRTAGKRGSKIGAKRVADLAREAYRDIEPVMRLLRKKGESLAAIAQHLNDTGHRTRRGRAWSKTQVKRVLDRARAGRTVD